MVAGRPTSRGRRLDVGDRLAERHAGRQIERDDHRRQLGDVVDGERRRLVVALGHGVERHQRAARRADLDAAQHLVGVGVLRVGLEDHLVGVVGRVDGRDLAACRRPSRAAGGSGRPTGRAARRCRGRCRSTVERARTCRSELTSMIVGMRRMRSSISGAYSRSAARSLERMPNWYWARVCVVPMLIDWIGWKKTLMPGTVAVARRSRAITCSAAVLALGLVAQGDEDAARVDGVGGVAAAHRRHHRRRRRDRA